MSILKDIHEAIRQNDFVEAVVIVQNALGQTDGGNASIFFTIDTEDDWRDLSPSGRFILMQSYIQYEIACLGILIH